MRIDVFLKRVGIFRSRNQAQVALKSGLVKKNGREAKPKDEVSIGDTIEISKRNIQITIKVKDIPLKQPRRSEFSNYYELIDKKLITEWKEESFWESIDKL